MFVSATLALSKPRNSISPQLPTSAKCARQKRLVAVGYLHKRLHILCFLPKAGGIRVISFRKANDREARKYGRAKTIDE